MIRYDNPTPAVVRVLLGRDRSENPRFVAMRSHHGYDSFFCRPGVDGAHEKGGVEGEIGRFRRQHLTPVPHVGSLAALRCRRRIALLLGSVSRAVARSAPCAVAVVGPHAVASASAAQPAKDESPLQASAS